MLLIQAESPAMIIYLDTDGSRSDGNNTANENYGREIMELFSMGVDNGYDQIDITQMAPCWTGWRTRMVTNVADYGNRHATPFNGPFTNVDGTITPGVWRFVFTPAVHGWSNTFNTNYLFYNWSGNTITGIKSVPARFGTPWTTNIYGTNTVPGNYALYIPPAANNSTSSNHVNDGYQIVKHLADLPFTQEYICYKLCGWFVNDSFKFGPVNGYDFSEGHVDLGRAWYGDSAEGKLLKACMLAWETNSPKGQLYKVLDTIFNSDLFRTNGLRTKVKTPFEYTVSAIRALKQNTNGTVTAGAWTADSDGYSVSGGNGNVAVPMERMGGMGLFDRETPDGYPEYAEAWVSAGTLTERVRFVQQFLMGPPYNSSLNTNKNDGINSGNPSGGSFNRNVTDPYGLAKLRLTASQMASDDSIASLFVNLIFPGEGQVNLESYRSAAKNWLNVKDDGVTPENWNTMIDGGTGNPQSGKEQRADDRLRGMVAFLMSMQRFNEQ